MRTISRINGSSGSHSLIIIQITGVHWNGHAEDALEICVRHMFRIGYLQAASARLAPFQYA